MKKKQIALLLAALLCVSPVAESMAVMGAEFSSEEDSEAQNAEKETLLEETADEAVDIDATGKHRRNLDIRRGRSC